MKPVFLGKENGKVSSFTGLCDSVIFLGIRHEYHHAVYHPYPLRELMSTEERRAIIPSVLFTLLANYLLYTGRARGQSQGPNLYSGGWCTDARHLTAAPTPASHGQRGGEECRWGRGGLRVFGKMSQRTDHWDPYPGRRFSRAGKTQLADKGQPQSLATCDSSTATSSRQVSSVMP